MTKWRSIANLPALFTLLAILAIWEIAARVNAATQRLISSPSQIANTILRDGDRLFGQHIPQTMLETLVGLGLAIVLGLLIAGILDFSPPIKKAIYPLLIVSQTIPIIALGTVLILLFGFGDTPKIIVVLVYCFFPITVAGVDGLNSTDPDLVALLRAMGATRWQVWWKVRIRAALPLVFSGIRIATTYSVGSAIIAEYITSDQGIGYYMRSAFKAAHNDQAYAAAVIAAVLSIVLVQLVNLIERIVLPWYFTEARDWNEPGIY
jgi:ABC-type nitrate/sulfonate/bicarbonate transport system permease component